MLNFEKEVNKFYQFTFFFRYNGQIPNGDRGRRKSKFQLRQRTEANGVKKQRQYICKNDDEVQVKHERNGKKKEK